MNKRILVIVAAFIIIFLLILFTFRKRNKNISKVGEVVNKSATNSIYDLMMNTVSRNIIGMDPSEMSSDEQEFYYQYLYEEPEEMVLYEEQF